VCAGRRSVQLPQLPVEHNELSERDDNRHCGADSAHALPYESGGLHLFPTPSKITLIGKAIQGEYLANKMIRTTCHSCQHTASLRLKEEYRRTAGGHTEPDGKTVVCGACGDSWHFRDRMQLPEWLRQELTDRGL
jgi:hypothetical protein